MCLNLQHYIIGENAYKVKTICSFCIILGTNKSSLYRLSKSGQYYVPVTVLQDDIRNLVIDKERVIAIFSKRIGDIKYLVLEYLAKGYNNVYELSAGLLDMIDENNLACNFGTSFIVKPVTYEQVVEVLDEVARTMGEASVSNENVNNNNSEKSKKSVI